MHTGSGIFYIWLNLTNFNCIHNFPIDFESNGLPFGSKSFIKIKHYCYGLVIKCWLLYWTSMHNRHESYNILALCFQVDNCSDTKGGKPLNRSYSISVSCLIVIIIWDPRNTLLQYQHRLLRDFDYSICIYSKSVGETSTTNTTLDWVVHI